MLQGCLNKAQTSFVFNTLSGIFFLFLLFSTPCDPLYPSPSLLILSLLLLFYVFFFFKILFLVLFSVKIILLFTEKITKRNPCDLAFKSIREC